MNVGAPRTLAHSWLLLIHQLPAKPAYLRVKIWRRLQDLGAVAVKNAVHALPMNEETQEDFEWLLREIQEGGGEAFLCEARLIDGLSDEEVRALFPDARILVLSSDLVATIERMREELADVAAGRFDIVIGTQLVAKGHHFPMLNLVGVVDADLGLSNGDPRAAERTFQLLHQVIGRAGRDAGVGVGLLQTHQPEHPVMRALIAQDREAFYAAEIALRENGLPISCERPC